MYIANPKATTKNKNKQKDVGNKLVVKIKWNLDIK
jgi:hypothetical protein